MKKTLKMSLMLSCLTLIFALQIINCPAYGGELKDKFSAAEKKAQALDKSVDKFAGESEKTVSNTWQLVQTGAAGIDQLFLYVDQKIKKAGKTLKSVENDPIQSVSDSNVESFMKGIADFKEKAVEVSVQWSSAGNELKDEIDKLQGDLNAITKAIDKRKKKLLQSKKYKDKLKNYEAAVDDLQKKTNTIETTLSELKNNAPPKPDQIKRTLEIKLSDPLKKLDNLASISVQNLLKEYTDVKKSSEKSIRKFRQAGDFKAELKMLNEMIKEADGMEADSK